MLLDSSAWTSAEANCDAWMTQQQYSRVTPVLCVLLHLEHHLVTKQQTKWSACMYAGSGSFCADLAHKICTYIVCSCLLVEVVIVGSHLHCFCA